MHLNHLTDKQLLCDTAKIVKIEKKYCYQVLCHLSEIYQRRLYCDFNYNSLYEYCIKELSYTSGEASYRVAAVKLMIKSTRIADAIREGELPLSNAVLLHNHLENAGKRDTKSAEDLASKIMGKSKSQAKEILEGTSKQSTESKKTKIKIEIDEEILELLKELKALTGKGEKAAIKEAIKLQVKALKSKREKQVQKDEKEQKPNTRYISQSEKAKVLLRANGRCEQVSEEGKRCCNTEKLEFDHIVPFAVGGKNTAKNLRLVCKGHNQRAAVKYYGKNKVYHDGMRS